MICVESKYRTAHNLPKSLIIFYVLAEIIIEGEAVIESYVSGKIDSALLLVRQYENFVIPPLQCCLQLFYIYIYLSQIILILFL